MRDLNVVYVGVVRYKIKWMRCDISSIRTHMLLLYTVCRVTYLITYLYMLTMLVDVGLEKIWDLIRMVNICLNCCFFWTVKIFVSQPGRKHNT